MKKTLFVAKKTTGAYVGGLISILDHYMNSKAVFASKGYEIEFFNYEAPEFLDRCPSKIQNLLYGFFQLWALCRKLKDMPEAIVHIHTSREFLFLKDIWLANRISRKKNVKVVMTIHVGTYDTVFNRIRFAEKWCLKNLNRSVRKVIFLSAVMRREFVEKGLNPDRTELIYNFHNLSVAGRVSSDRDTLKLLFVGAIHKEKGIIELLRALYALDDPKVTLDVCGMLTDPSIKAEFETLTEKLGERVKLHGYVSGEQKSTIFHNSDVLILPSYHEGFPLVILEGLAAGCALISTPVGATTEVLSEDNVSWVNIGSADDIAAAIKEYQENPQRLRRVQQANLELAKEFTIQANVDRTCELYDSL